ncbi:LOW QUALITY PROTEIN: ewing's tumor-associated antigen 1 [Peromyscus leucopus]|uniref:LOW QUALITY PROTEIN: ewing's tumor-associated antigen 1 n=1 Tax=Peromyscus leucopus TaxID=10041 RepID=UPI0010A1F034|nr:LOW QUALITY PROTEIN: ewing's tumor-associated antigen 1 [Peromyscus leucopus]
MRQEESASGMSRRRKHADSPARRSTPRRAAAEDCCSAGEPGSRWSRTARDSRLCRAGARPLRREQRRAAADSGRSPGEKYKTPTRVVKTDLLSCAFSSPNDPDGQTDIFWDQNSPLTKQLGKGRRKQISSTYTDEISHIVSRIAPQDEKPVTNSMLGVWIGDTAIPCTPSVAKEKSRVKISCTKLKTQNREKELMKLAKQFDKNMEELDVIQEQDVKNHDFIQTTSEVGHLHNLQDSAQTETDDTVPEISCALLKKQMEENTRISVAKEQDRIQKPFDQNVEAALNAIFDGSTQMCSGQLSQDLPDAFVNNSKTTFVKQRSLIEEEVTNETLLTENLPDKTLKSPSPQVDTALLQKSCVTPCAKKPEASNKHLDGLTTSDFEDDWESLLGNEPFLMENAEMLELFPSTTAQVTGQKAVCTVIAQNDTITSTTNKNLDGKLRDSKVTLDLPSKTCNRELRNSEGYRFLSHPSDESSKLPLTGSKVRFEKSFNNIKNEGCVDVSNLIRVKEDSRKCTFNVCASDNSGSYSRYPNEKNVNLPLKAPIIDCPLGSVSLGKENSVCIANQTNASKFSSSLDDWNDPLVASEMIKACHELETTWEADDVDDDLLCQACDDIERLTQQENKGSKEAESINNTPKHRSRNTWTASKRSQAVPSTHWNPVGSSVPSSLPKNSLIHPSVKVEKRDTCGDYPNILDATTNLSVCPKNSNDHQHVPLQVNSSKFILAGSSSLNVSLGPKSTEMTTNKLSTHQLSHGTLADRAQNDSKIQKFSKFTFKTKNPQFLSQLNQSCIAGSMPVSKILQDFGKKETVNSLFEANQQQSSIKYSESLKPSSKGEEERNRKYSPEEIQRKRQEALVRRKAKAQANPAVHSAPIALL